MSIKSPKLPLFLGQRDIFDDRSLPGEKLSRLKTWKEAPCDFFSLKLFLLSNFKILLKMQKLSFVKKIGIKKPTSTNLLVSNFCDFVSVTIVTVPQNKEWTFSSWLYDKINMRKSGEAFHL